MVDRDQRLIEGKGESFCVTDSHQQSSCQAGTLSYSDCVDRMVGMAGFTASAWRTTGTIARKCSRDASSGTTPPYGLMSRDLGCDNACPFCITMFEDGIKAVEAQDKFGVEDIAEILARALDAQPVGAGSGPSQSPTTEA